jgi:hypothetical protein
MQRIHFQPLSKIYSCYCSTCNFVYFDHRLSDIEAQRLYEEYRGETYNRTRIALEPEYAAMAADFADLTSEYWRRRIFEYQRIFDASLIRVPRNLLDFGGDGFVPSMLFDNSIVSVDDLSITSTADIKKKYEVIMACEVFEHLSDPLKVLKDLRERLSEFGFIFLGVPKEFEDPISLSFHRSSKNQDSSLTFFHEHINHFSNQALKMLAQYAGLEIYSQFTTQSNYRIILLTNKALDSEASDNLLERQERMYMKFISTNLNWRNF